MAPEAAAKMAANSESSSDLTISDAQLMEMLPGMFGVENRVKSLSIASPTVGQNYMSATGVVTIEWDPPQFADGRKTIHSVFIKFPTPEKLRRGDDDEMTPAIVLMQHKNECLFYHHLRHTDPDLIRLSPDIYYSQPADKAKNDFGIIALEDMSQRSGVVDLLDGLNLQQLLEAAKATGIAHAWSLKNTSWKESVVTFWDINPDPTRWIEVVQASVNKLLSEFPASFSAVSKEMLSELMSPAVVAKLEAERKQHPEALVLIHGDLWINNLMYRLDKATNKLTDELVAVIDWQNLYPGLGPADLCRTLASSCTSSIRRQHYEQIFRAYYDSMQAKHAPEPLPFSFEDVLRWYKLSLLNSGTFSMIFGITVFLADQRKRGATQAQIEEVLDRAATGLVDSYDYLKECGVL